jgi:hypothetical protein
VVGEAAAAVEVDGGVTVVDFEVEDFGVVFAGGAFGEIEELGADSLSTVGGFDEEFVDPGAFAAIFEAVIEADDEVGDGRVILARDVCDAVNGILEEFGEVGADGGFVEGFFPGVVELHVAHQEEEGFEIGWGGLGEGEGHGSFVDFEGAAVLYVEILRGANGARLRMTVCGGLARVVVGD